MNRSKAGQTIALLLLGSFTLSACASRSGWEYAGETRAPLQSAYTFNHEAIESYPAYMSLEDIMVARIPGLQVIYQSGIPRVALQRYAIRGTANPALYVVDGTPTDSSVFINPRDVGKVEVLRDAASTALYGFRGMYGVVLITSRYQ